METKSLFKGSTPSKLQIALAFLSIYIIWGSTYLAILYTLKSIPPFLLSGFRFSIAGAVLIGWRLANGEKPLAAPAMHHAFGGILMLSGGTGAVAWAEQYISSGLAAIIIASMPFWFVILDYRQWSYNFSQKMVLFGVLMEPLRPAEGPVTYCVLLLELTVPLKNGEPGVGSPN